jgi:hypothetical protein
MNTKKNILNKLSEKVNYKTDEIFKDLELKIEDFMFRDPSLTLEWKENVLESLKNPEVKKVLILFFEHQVVGWTLLNGAVWLPISVAASGPLVGPLISEGVRGSLKYLFTNKRMKGFDGKNILSMGCATPVPGTFFPLLYLYKRHPELVEYVYLYMTPLLNIIKNKNLVPENVIENIKAKLSLQMMNMSMYTKIIKNIVIDLLIPAYSNFLETDINNLKLLYKGLNPHDYESINAYYDIRLDGGKFLIKLREYLNNTMLK